MPSRELTDVTLMSEDEDEDKDKDEDEDEYEDEDEDEDELTSVFGLIGPKTKKLLVLRPKKYWSWDLKIIDTETKI